MRHSMPIPTENATPEEWLAYANWLRNTENARLAKKVVLFRKLGNYVAEEDFLFEIEENEKEAKYIENMYVPIKEYESILNGNTFRTAKKTKRRKQNKKHHKADRYHGKKLMVIKYKENHEVKEGLSWLYRDCHCPVGDDVKYSLNGIIAREQDFLYNPSISEMEIEQEEKRIMEEDERILDNHYALENVVTTLKEGKYISLFSYWNGEYWEDSSTETNKFCGIKTAEEVKDKVLTEQARRIHLPEIEMETVHGMEGVSFKWNGFYDWDDEECGYRKLTFLPID